MPIIINGVDASYAVVEGDWGLGKGTHVQPTVYGGRYVDPVPNVGHYYPSAGRIAGLRPARDRAAGEPQIAAAGRKLSPVLVGAVGTMPAQSNVPVNPPPVIVAPQINDGRIITAIRGPQHFRAEQTNANKKPRQQRSNIYRRE